jgi:hypothetical protein
MEKKHPTEKQHFVPQHYLKQFRCAGTEQVFASTVEPYRFIGQVSIKAQCQADYFYGDDGVIEATLGEAENAIAPILVDVCQRERFNAQEGEVLRLLAVLLYTRTRKTIDAAKLFPKRWGNSVIKHGIATGELPEPEGGWKEDMLEFHGVQGLILKIGMRCWFEMRTLECKLLKAPAGTGFITNDNPVLLLNQFTQASLPARSFVGFAQSGFQLLLPISPKLCLYFYDPKVYKVGSGRSQVVNISAADLDVINGFMVQAAEHCVYFNETVQESYVKKLVSEHGTLRVPASQAIEVLPSQRSNEELVRIRPLTLKLTKGWKFTGYRRHISSKPGTQRQPAWTALVQQAMDEFKKDPSRADIFERMHEIASRDLDDSMPSPSGDL